MFGTTKDPSSLDFTGDDSHCPWMPMGHRATTVKSYDCVRLHPLRCPGDSSRFLGRGTIAGGLRLTVCILPSFKKALMGHDWINCMISS